MKILVNGDLTLRPGSYLSLPGARGLDLISSFFCLNKISKRQLAVINIHFLRYLGYLSCGNICYPLLINVIFFFCHHTNAPTETRLYRLLFPKVTQTAITVFFQIFHCNKFKYFIPFNSRKNKFTSLYECKHHLPPKLRPISITQTTANRIQYCLNHILVTNRL